MKFIYPAKFYEEAGKYWAEFPDLDGCQTYAESLPEAITYASEALEGYLETLLESEIKFNSPSRLEDINDDDAAFVNYIYCNIDLAKFSKSVKKTLTIPAWLNQRALEKGRLLAQR